MKKILLLAYALLSVILLPAQGIYQLWGMTENGGGSMGTIFKTSAGNSGILTIHPFPLTTLGTDPEKTELSEFDGKFYGVTHGGGNSDYNAGVIFEWDPLSKMYTKKLDFNLTNGRNPWGGLTLMGNKFYGTTMHGGINDQGTIFEWDPVTNVFNKKFDFNGTNGRSPLGTLLFSDRKFYGTTVRGGINDGGTLFEWDPVTNIFTKKFDFDDKNGMEPVGNMTQGSDGRLYGLTLEGGVDGGGVIYAFSPTTNVINKEFEFKRYGPDTTGYLPWGRLALSNGKFYGTTQNGGRNSVGVIFEWDPIARVFTRKIDLNQIDGAGPIGGLTLVNGKFYSTTQTGGINDGGVIFEWDPVTNIYVKKIDLVESTGIRSAGSLLFSDNKFYGLTSSGGDYGVGVLFEWDLYTNTYTNWVNFGDYSKSSGNPSGSLIQHGSKLYGMLPQGGSNGVGLIFELDLYTHAYTEKFEFDGINGARPYGSLTFENGKFYGLTGEGGTNNVGVIFEWDPITNEYVKKIDLNYENGSRPYGNLTAGFNKKFYGLTQSGGAHGEGVLFEWDPITNIYCKKVDLSLENGNLARGSLTLKGNKLFGMTSRGGAYDMGVIFEWDPVENLYTIKVDIKNWGENPAENPIGNLVVKDDKFYGLAGGGANQTGVIFEWDPVTNSFSRKFDFHSISSADGSYPTGSLTLNGDIFYGMTNSGGGYRRGVLFEWDPSINVYVKKVDLNYNIGYSPSIGNTLAQVKAPTVNGVPGSCTTFQSVSVNSSNYNQWISIVDHDGNAVAEIKANGNNLGIVTASVFINDGKVREDGTGRLYLDRSITLTPQYPQKSVVDIRLYIKGSEYTALKNAHNSFGQTAGINSINDIGIFKIKGGCAPAAATISNLINTSGAAWENDYVLSASINSFTSFYFACKNPCAAPVIAGVSASTSALSPADHQMKNLTVNYSAKGNCFPITTWLTVTSNEPVSGTGNGDLSPDWIIVDDHHLQLRSERSVSGTGRIYTITVNAKNAFGTYCKKTIKVMVTALPVTLAKTADSNNEGGLFDCKVIPNPASQYFNLEVTTQTDEKISVTLLDASGRKIKEMNTTKNRLLRFGDDLRPGAYMIKVTQGKQQKIIQIIKE